VVPHFRRFEDLATPNTRRRHLPHWETAGASYFVTFRLADSLPTGIVRQIEIRANAWLKVHGLKNRDEIHLLLPQLREDFRRLLARHEHRALDSGFGNCTLRSSECRELLLGILREKDEVGYRLDQFVIMPNHVHLLVLPLGQHSLTVIVGDWKKHSTRLINKMLNRTGKLWQQESFDHVIRTAEKFASFRLYIEENPVKARLRAGEYSVGRGSGIVL
jgi:putative transposase